MARRTRTRTKALRVLRKDSTGRDVVRDHSIEWSRIRATILKRLETGEWPKEAGPRAQGHVRFESWSGGTETQVGSWLRDGYRLSGGDNLQHGEVLTGTRRRMVWGDDGDLDVGQALSGADFPFQSWTRRLSKPGLAIVAEVSFNADVPAELLAEYGAWITRMVTRLEGRGYDVRADVVIPLRNLCEGDPRGSVTETTIVLKRENEATDFRSWSPVFSPAGFRVFGFLALCLMAQDKGETLTSGLGQAHGSGRWGVAFNPTTRTMRITIPGSRVDAFDADAMTDAFLAALPEGDGATTV